MAKKSSSNKPTKYYPVDRRMDLAPTSPNGTTACVRVDKLLSEVNHRLYRQSRVYEVKLDLDADVIDETVDIYALRPTWYVMNAYQLAYETFLKNSREEDAKKARWNDFRVQSGWVDVNTFVQPLGHDGNGTTASITGGEYEYSQVHNAAGDQREFSWSLQDATTYNIVAQYDVEKNTDVSSTTGSAVPYDGLSDDVDSGQQEHLQSDGNAPPYSATTLDDDIWVRIATLHTGASGAQKLSTGYFDAPCGFVMVQKRTGNYGSGTMKMTLQVKGGDYKGVAGHQMLDFEAAEKALKEA